MLTETRSGRAGKLCVCVMGEPHSAFLYSALIFGRRKFGKIFAIVLCGERK